MAASGVHVRLYIANQNSTSWSLRPWVLMKQRGHSFEEIVVPFERDGGHVAAYRALSPTGRLPALHVDGVVIWDSLAIVEYLAERDPEVWPQEPVARAWARSAAAEMHSGFAALRSVCSMSCGHRVRLRAHPQALEADIARLDELWRDGLGRFGGPFLADERFTAVDAFFAPVAFRLQTYGLRVSPSALEYCRRLLALPSMQAWYSAALAEPWRDEEHDADTARHGEVEADLRAPPGSP
ncbi:glutathione S-transferase [Deltaproteobacteria bacterium]|nr:glutathione S-transferase [Deltaproteobacteria bacterium]